MILFFVASLLLSLTSGILLTFLFCPSLKNGAAGPAFRFFAGGGLGIGVTSCLYFVCLLAGLTRYLPAMDLGVCLLLGISCFVFFRRHAVRGGGIRRFRKLGNDPISRSFWPGFSPLNSSPR